MTDRRTEQTLGKLFKGKIYAIPQRHMYCTYVHILYRMRKIELEKNKLLWTNTRCHQMTFMMRRKRRKMHKNLSQWCHLFLPAFHLYHFFLQSKQIIMYEAYVWTDRVYARADRGGTHRKTKRRTKSNCRSEHRKSKQLQKFINKFKTVLCFLLLLFWKINKKKFIAFSPKNKIDDLWLIDCCLPKIISKKRK